MSIFGHRAAAMSIFDCFVDLPSVVSGNKIAFFDPLQEHFGGKTGRLFLFEEARRQEYADQFRPFEVLDCCISQNEYNGTLFRFPLRQTPSPDLSSNICTLQRMRELFQSFQVDAHLVLLFLKTVEVISVYEWLPDKIAAQEVFQVGFSEVTKTVIRKERKDIVGKISTGKLEAGFVLSSPFRVSITCTSHRNHAVTQEWLVENYISTADPRVHSMASKLAQIPWVGLAVPIGKKTEHGTKLGRIFCFLPLPPSDDADSNSGLPVHVHGSFSVADNRRSLKWPAKDRTKDEKAEWNCLLAQQLIPQAYISLIRCSIELDRALVSVADIYAMWPDIDRVQYHWSQYVIPPLLTSLSQCKVLYGLGVSEGVWESVESVLVSDNAEKSLRLDESVAIQEMKRIGHKVAFPTANVASCLTRIENEDGVGGRQICPDYVRDELRKSNRYEKMQPHNKIQLLKYVLRDCHFGRLVGLCLLPLGDGTFTTFSLSGCSTVYLESSSCPRSLFPGQDAKFLDEKIDKGVYATLSKVAATGFTQLKAIQSSDVPSLVSEVLSPVQELGGIAINCSPEKIGDRLTDNWIAELWLWINQNISNVSLKEFENLFIVPVTSTHGVKKLMKLVSGFSAIFAKLPHFDVWINEDLARGLENLGCTVLYNSPEYLVSCSDLWNTYVCQPVHILTCISRATNFISMCHVLTQAQRNELLRVVAAAVRIRRPSDDEINVLTVLPIFRQWGKENLESLSSSESCNQVAPAELEETLPIQATLIASPSSETSQIMGFVCGAYDQLTLEEVFDEFVFSQFQMYTSDVKEKLIMFALDNIHLMSSDACQSMTSLAFIKTSDDHQLRAPNEVFSPNERYVSELYEDQCVFPVGSFALNSKYGDLLYQHVGLRKLSDITADELYFLAERIAAKKSKPMAKTLLKVLNEEDWAQQLLQTYRSNQTICWQALASVAWIPVIEHSSSIIAFGMPWTCSSPTCLPSCVVVPSVDLSSERLQLTVGTQLAILDYTSVISPSVVNFLSCASLSTIYEAVIKQLIVAHNLWKTKSIEESGREKFDRMLQEVFSTLGSAFCSSFATVILDGLKSAPADWVWLNGSQGFIRPEQLAVSSAFPGSLEPWLYEIGHYPHLNACSALLKTSGMKSKFEEEDILYVLPSMKAFYDSSTFQLEHKKMERDLELTITILNLLTRDRPILPQSFQQNLLVPVDREDNVLELCPCSELMYCDAEWLRRSDDVEVADYRLIHKQVSSDTAYKLGVPSLSNRLAPSEELPFEQLGPHESLTLRLKNILKEYKDDAGIFKELLQNADDAGATSVKFLVDWREHDQFKSSLLAPGMSKCQGPALWAFNDSVFSDEDFVNISKLAAATKQSKLEKIGRFGLGFTSVYHITDVPSFVSRRYVVIFDPHKSHLGNHIRNPSQPGIKIDFVQRPIGQRFPDQFQPYGDVFGCNLVNCAEFNGTLFRFPFRTNEQAAVNEIKNETYDEDRVKASLRALQEVCGKLLIFLQHVKSVEVFELKSDAVSPSDMRQILSVQAGAEASSSLLFYQELLTSICSQVERGRFENTAGCSSTRAIKWRNFHTNEVRIANWLVSSDGGKGDAFQFSREHGGHERRFVPFASVAVELSENGVPCAVDGETFCFLPLSERTGLPLHVNGMFAVLSNRRGIWWHGTDEARIGGKTDVEAEWNENLISDCLVESYILLLKHWSDRLDYREEVHIDSSHYYALWPNETNLHHAAWATFVSQFYKNVVNGTETLFPSMSNDGFKLISLRDCVILSNSVREMLPHAQQIMKQVCPSYVELPKHVWDGLHRANSNIMETVTVGEENFILKWFAPHVQKMNFEIRDDLLKKLLTRVLTTGHLISCLSNLAIFPCCPDGQMLRAASDMIDPNCDEAELFEEEEKKFPVESLCVSDELVLAFRKLGMKSTGSFTWENVVERSATVETLEKASHTQANRRIGALVKLIDSLCKKPEQCSVDHLELLRNTPFLLVESCPKDYPIVWYADQQRDRRVVTPVEGYTWKFRYAVGSQAYIIDSSLHGVRFSAVIDLLGLSSLPPLSMLIMQLDLVIAAFQEVGTNTSSLMEIIDMLYKDLQRRYDEDEADDIVTQLYGKTWIVVEGHAMKSNQLAFEWRKSAPPYLSSVPSELLHMKRLLEDTGVQKVFQPEHFVIALQQICAAANGKRLREPLVSYVEHLIIPEFASLTKSDLKIFRGNLEVPLLSEDGRLIAASELAYNDAPWMDSLLTGEHVYVHSCVPRVTAERLGVKLVRDTVLDSYARDIPGIEFGQHEPLTKRLKNILEGYPADEGILKELLQNADDAKATEIHVILDQRQYKRTRVFSDRWKSLQGPAICVYNNRPFTDKDIKGIQNLGRGSKSDDPSLTGQYGIGFNAVYHLTDCPSFLSDNKKLCVLDPHCRYVRGATKERPGRLFDTDEKFWNQFCDIWDCYKSIDGITLEGGTLFRLPLRTKEMADISEVSENVFDTKRVEGLMTMFKESAPSMLLFLNNIKCIKLTSISKDSLGIKCYEVKATLSSRAEEERQRMSKIVADSKCKPTADIEYATAFYELDIHESEDLGKVCMSGHAPIEEGQWLVHHSIGIPHRHDSVCVEEGCRMSLLPRVGIAAPIRRRLRPAQTNLFCFLPLPVKWKLPVQINGHFALDSTRRALWYDSKESHRSVKQRWNECLIKFVVAPAYARFLIEARRFVTISQEGIDTHACLRKNLEWFHHLLPLNIGKDSGLVYLDLLVQELYEYIIEHNYRLLPYTGEPAVPLHEYIRKSTEEQQKLMKKLLPAESGDIKFASVEWLEIGKKTDTGMLTAYFSGFDNEDGDGYALNVFLLRCGFPIVVSPPTLHAAILNAKKDAIVECVNPEAVHMFLKNYQTAGSCCRLQLGSVEDTILKSCEAVKLLLEYVLKASIKIKRDTTSDAKCDTSYLSGLPLLVTADGRLCQFSTSSTVFVSGYSSLLPKGRHLFVHRELRSTVRSFTDPVWKKLSPSDLVHYLPDQDIFPPDWLVSHHYRKWDPDVGPSKEWITKLWSYLMKCTKLSNSIECLKALPIISVGDGRMLVPPCLSCTVFWSLPTTSQSPFADVCQALLNLGVVCVDSFITCQLQEHNLERVLKFAVLDNVPSVVKALQYLYTSRCPEVTSVSDTEKILKYFQNSTMDFLTVNILRQLPLFETVDRKLVAVPTFSKACTLPDLPDAGRDIWMSIASCIFLQSKILFGDLYKRLGLHDKSTTDVYLNYILPCFDRMSQSDRVVHLVFLMNLDVIEANKLTPPFTVRLRCTPCFDYGSEIRRVSDFYHPGVQVFALMLPNEKFPPTPPESVLPSNETPKWLLFLIKLGLKMVCSTSEFLDFAKLLEDEALTWKQEGREPDGYEVWNKTSTAMVSHLADCMQTFWNDRKFISTVREIRFLPVVTVTRELEQLALPFYKRDKAVNYATSYSEGVKFSRDNENLCWTSQALVKEPWSQYQSREVLRRGLSIQMIPSLTSVLSHFCYLIDAAKQNIQPEKEAPKNIVNRLVDSLSFVFGHLSKIFSNSTLPELSPFADLRNNKCFTKGLSADCGRVVEFLTSCQCIFLKDKQMFVKPHQCVVVIRNEFHPYLFRCPSYLAPYHRLLKRIGVEDEVRPFHCARILEAIQQRCRYGEDELPGDANMLQPVVKLLFETLKSEIRSVAGKPIRFSQVDIENALKPLFLPSRDNMLVSSQELVYLDLFHLDKQVEGLRYQFLIDLRRCGLSSLAEETVDLLPENIRPRKLSTLTVEVLDPQCRLSMNKVVLQEEDVSAAAAMYEDHLTSSYFVKGIRSIYINSRKESTIPETLHRGLDILRNRFHVKCLPEIRTCLQTVAGELLELNGSRKRCFLEQSRLESTLYVEAKAIKGKAHINLFVLIVRELQMLLQTQLPESCLLAIASCENAHLIPSILGDLGIPYEYDDDEDPEEITVTENRRYRPGMEVIPSHLEIIRQSPLGYRFNVDEWVAYEVDSNRFIYAVVLYQACCEDDMESELETRYGIDVGDEEPVVVSVLLLYAFVRNTEVDSEGCVVLRDDSQPSSGSTAAADTPTTLEGKKDLVRRQMQEIWKLPALDRKRAIRRMYLEWHPDKTDDPDAEEVFKFLLNEIERFERGDSQSDDVSYSRHYSSWNSFAKQHRRRHRSSSSYSFPPPPTYYSSSSSSSHSSSGHRRQGGTSGPSETQLFPNRIRGLMFVEQAKADLGAAEALFSAGSDDSRRYAAVCFFCHEVVEKALKGLLFIFRGIPEDRRIKHNIGFFLGAGDLPGCPSTLKWNASMISDSYYLDTRYPDRENRVPATVYSCQDAEYALNGARGVIEDTRNFLGDND